jgi:hypothetical protein
VISFIAGGNLSTAKTPDLLQVTSSYIMHALQLTKIKCIVLIAPVEISSM